MSGKLRRCVPHGLRRLVSEDVCVCLADEVLQLKVQRRRTLHRPELQHHLIHSTSVDDAQTQIDCTAAP